jgi:hypothetical protein
MRPPPPAPLRAPGAARTGAQEVNQEPPLGTNQPEQDQTNYEARKLSSRESAQPPHGTRFDAIASRLQDEARQGSERAVARERGPADRGRVQLPKAVAVGLASAGEVGADPYDEEQQERQGPKPPHQDVARGINEIATASSASGSTIAKGATRAAGTPKSIRPGETRRGRRAWLPRHWKDKG